MNVQTLHELLLKKLVQRNSTTTLFLNSNVHRIVFT